MVTPTATQGPVHRAQACEELLQLVQRPSEWLLDSTCGQLDNAGSMAPSYKLDWGVRHRPSDSCVF